MKLKKKRAEEKKNMFRNVHFSILNSDHSPVKSLEAYFVLWGYTIFRSAFVQAQQNAPNENVYIYLES